jgi:hypothetical protein
VSGIRPGDQCQSYDDNREGLATAREDKPMKHRSFFIR